MWSPPMTMKAASPAAELVEVRSRVRGHLQKVYFQDGQKVKKGDPLFDLDPRPFEAELEAAKAQMAAAEAGYKLAASEFKRSKYLASKNAASDREADVWEAKQDVAQADKLKAEATIKQVKQNLDYAHITAEQDGRISRTCVDVGNLVNAGGGETHLATIVATDPMYVYFDVDERSLIRYRRDFAKTAKPDEPRPSVKELKIPVQVALEGETGFPHKGVIDFADNRVNPSTGTIQVRGVLANTGGLFTDGMRPRAGCRSGMPPRRC